VTRLRQVWPVVVLLFRGDCAFGVPGMYEVCEGLTVSYTFGLSTNAVLQRETEGLLAEAVAASERDRQAGRQQESPRTPVPSRLFTGFWYQAGTWPQPRWVVAKAEANDRGTNRRFVVSNRPGAAVLPGPTYDEYAGRGESENRNKEFKCDLAMGRLSDHRFVANYLRLYLHAAAMNLLVRLRRFIAEPLPVPVPPAETAAPATSQAVESTSLAAGEVVPAEALTGPERQRHFRKTGHTRPKSRGPEWAGPPRAFPLRRRCRGRIFTGSIERVERRQPRAPSRQCGPEGKPTTQERPSPPAHASPQPRRYRPCSPSPSAAAAATIACP
jgi:hypothetical protein